MEKPEAHKHKPKICAWCAKPLQTTHPNRCCSEQKVIRTGAKTKELHNGEVITTKPAGERRIGPKQCEEHLQEFEHVIEFGSLCRCGHFFKYPNGEFICVCSPLCLNDREKKTYERFLDDWPVVGYLREIGTATRMQRMPTA